MPLWMTFPSIAIPDKSMLEHPMEPDANYKRIDNAFYQIPRLSHIDLDVDIPRSQADRETLASAAVECLLKEHISNQSWKPDFFVDCQSSNAVTVAAPTYKLAMLCNVKDTIPFSLSGQWGTEVASAMLFFEPFSSKLSNGVLISAVQRVITPDSRFFENHFPLADGGAAVLLSNKPDICGPKFRVLGVSLAQSPKDWASAWPTPVDAMLQRAGASIDLINWAVAHRANNEFLYVMKNLLPNANWLVRDLYSEFDFGAADLLISLENLRSSIELLPSSIGLLCFRGIFGAMGFVLLRYESL